MIRLPELLVIVAIIIVLGGYKAFPKIAASIKESKELIKDEKMETNTDGTEGK